MLERRTAARRRRDGGRTPWAPAQAVACGLFLFAAASFAQAGEAAGPAPATPSSARVDGWGDPLPPGAVARIGTERFAGWGPFAFAPDGKTYCCGATLSCRGDEQLVVCDAATGVRLRRLDRHGDQGPTRVVYAPDGVHLASLDVEGVLRIWDAASGGLRHEIRDASKIHVVAFSGDGRRLATGSDFGCVRLRQVSDGGLVDCWKGGPFPVEEAAFLKDGKTLATLEGGRLVQLRDLESGRVRAALDVGAFGLFPLTTTSDGALATVGRSVDGGIELWDVRAGVRRRSLLGHARGTYSALFSPDDRLLASAGGDDRVRIWEAASGRLLHAFPFRGRVHHLAFSPDGGTLTASLAARGNRLLRWNVADGVRLGPEDETVGEVRSLAFPQTPAAELWSVSEDGTLRGWDARRGAAVRTFPPPRSNRGSKDAFWFQQAAPGPWILSPDGRSAASTVESGFQILDLVGGGPPKVHRGRPGDDVDWMALSRDGRVLAWQDDSGAVRVWDVAAAKLLREFPAVGAPDAVDGSPRAALSADGRTIVHALDGGEYRGFDVASGALLGALPEVRSIHCLAVSPDGATVAAVDAADAIGVWDLRSGGLVGAAFSGDPDPARSFASLHFAPDGRTLAAIRQDEIWGPGAAVHLFETASARRIAVLDGHAGGVAALAFSPDGRSLAVAGAEGAFLLWALDGRTGLRPSAPDPADLDALWKALSERDLPDADALLWQAAAQPQAAAFLRERLKPTPPPPRARALVAELDDDRFAVREKAEAELAAVGFAAWGALREHLPDRPPIELGVRARRLLRKALDPAAPENLRAARAVAILERSADPAARRFLLELAAGDEVAVLARAAQRALARLERAAGKR